MKSPRIADEWEPYLAEKAKEQSQLTAKLLVAEADLNARVTASSISRRMKSSCCKRK